MGYDALNKVVPGIGLSIPEIDCAVPRCRVGLAHCHPAIFGIISHDCVRVGVVEADKIVTKIEYA
jgi:hypothetical protein